MANSQRLPNQDQLMQQLSQQLITSIPNPDQQINFPGNQVFNDILNNRSGSVQIQNQKYQQLQNYQNLKYNQLENLTNYSNYNMQAGNDINHIVINQLIQSMGQKPHSNKEASKFGMLGQDISSNTAYANQKMPNYNNQNQYSGSQYDQTDGNVQYSTASPNTPTAIRSNSKQQSENRQTAEPQISQQKPAGTSRKQEAATLPISAEKKSRKPSTSEVQPIEQPQQQPQQQLVVQASSQQQQSDQSQNQEQMKASGIETENSVLPQSLPVEEYSSITNDIKKVLQAQKKIQKKAAKKGCSNIYCKSIKKLNEKIKKIKSKITDKQLNFCTQCYTFYQNEQFCEFCEQVYDTKDTQNQDDKDWIECDECKRWNHVECEVKDGNKTLERDLQNVSFKYYCKKCQKKVKPTAQGKKKQQQQQQQNYKFEEESYLYDNEKLLSLKSKRKMSVEVVNNPHIQISKNARKQSQEVTQGSNEIVLEKSDNFIYDIQFQQYKTKTKNRKSNNASDFQPLHCCINGTYGLKLDLPQDQIQQDFKLMQKIISGIALTEEDYQIVHNSSDNGQNLISSKRNNKKNYAYTRSENLSVGEESIDFKRYPERISVINNDESQTTSHQAQNHSFGNHHNLRNGAYNYITNHNGTETQSHKNQPNKNQNNEDTTHSHKQQDNQSINTGKNEEQNAINNGNSTSQNKVENQKRMTRSQNRIQKASQNAQTQQSKSSKFNHSQVSQNLNNNINSSSNQDEQYEYQQPEIIEESNKRSLRSKKKNNNAQQQNNDQL